jgi:hypothetical protein
MIGSWLPIAVRAANRSRPVGPLTVVVGGGTIGAMTKGIDASTVRVWRGADGTASVFLAISAAVVALLAVAEDAVAEFAFARPHPPRHHYLPALLLMGALVLLAIGLSGAGGEGGPVGFLRRPGAFVAPPSRAYGLFLGAQALTCGFASSLSVEHWSHAGFGRDYQTTTDVAVWGFVSLLCLLLAAATAVALRNLRRGRPAVELTPAALVVSTARGRIAVPWTALRRGAPPLAGNRHVTVDAGRRLRISLRNVRVNPPFLAEAIGCYAVDASRRAEIGRPAEYAALLAGR